MLYHINDDGQTMREGVDLNYQQNYIKIEAPALDGKTPATMIHEVSKV